MPIPAARACLATAFVIAMLVPCAPAQRSGDPHAGGAVDLPSAGSPIMERNTDPRSVFISGKVVLQGGGPAGRIAIERICNGMARREGYTNSKGNFQFEPARAEYEKALAADPKFISPYFGLATIAVVENKWAEAVQRTDELIQLNSLAYPMAYFFNAAANLNLGKLDAAELSARKFQQVDKAHTRPDIALLLATILTSKHQYAEAAQLYRDYLAVKPDAANAEELKKEAQRLDGLSAAKQQ